jgi:hypothetical protein
MTKSQEIEHIIAKYRDPAPIKPLQPPKVMNKFTKHFQQRIGVVNNPEKQIKTGIEQMSKDAEEMKQKLAKMLQNY